MDIIRNVVSGEVRSDSIEPLDSLALRQKEKLLEERSKLTEEFMATYEIKEKDNLTLFEAAATTPVYTLFRPARGKIEQHYDRRTGEKGITLRTARQENICAVMAGTIVYEEQTLEQEWVVIIQHEGDYMSVYKQLQKPFKKTGESVDAGETIALVGSEMLFQFELWLKGAALNPEELIAF